MANIPRWFLLGIGLALIGVAVGGDIRWSRPLVIELYEAAPQYAGLIFPTWKFMLLTWAFAGIYLVHQGLMKQGVKPEAHLRSVR